MPSSLIPANYVRLIRERPPVPGAADTPSTDFEASFRAPGERPRAYAVYVDDRDMVWVSDWGANAMVRFDNRGQAIRRVTVSADEKSNSLIVSGARADLQDAASVVERLDGETSGGGDRKSTRLNSSH